MKRILVPVDFSPTAEKAFRFAADIAAKARGTIILYHVYTPVESAFVATGQKRKQYNAQTEVNLVKRLQRLKKKVIGESAGVTVSTIVGRPPLVDNILGFAEHNHIDLVVLGTQGASGLKKTIIGSVAARIIEKSVLPVLLVPSKYEYAEPRQFVLTTNFHQADKQAIKIICDLAKHYEAAITVLYFLSLYKTESEKEKERTDFDTYAYSLQRKFSDCSMKFHLLETSSVTETLENLDKKMPYDIMIMVRRKKSFLEKLFVKSFTKKMAYLTNKPLLIVPEVV